MVRHDAVSRRSWEQILGATLVFDQEKVYARPLLALVISGAEVAT
jgi:hypothetical protein